MKTIFLFCLVAAGGGAAMRWGGSLFQPAAAVLPDCCIAPPQATAGAPSAGNANPISPRSLYQLDSTWTDDSGTPRKLASLRDGPVVVAMFFSSCEYACPIIVADMLRVRAALPEAVRARTRFLLVSFDDVRDTPPVLRAYRTKMGLDDPAWTLLRGGAPDVQEFAMLLGVKYKRDAAGQFSHSNLITVLNPAGEISFQREGLKGEPAEIVNAVAATQP